MIRLHIFSDKKFNVYCTVYIERVKFDTITMFFTNF
ncbi:hypothetical protein [Caudoviricetes sp.]|nr:hypothetical protein [Caudoviricetes sp.]